MASSPTTSASAGLPLPDARWASWLGSEQGIDSVISWRPLAVVDADVIVQDVVDVDVIVDDDDIFDVVAVVAIVDIFAIVFVIVIMIVIVIVIVIFDKPAVSV